MYQVSNAFKDAVYAQTRESKGKIEFEILDVDSAGDATPTVTAESSFSLKDQLYNGVRQTSGKFATFENDYWLLDGSFVLPPKTSESGFEVGWWSSALSQSNKTFAVTQVCTTDFTVDHSSIGLTITFDTLTNEYAEDFTITFKNSVGGTIYTATVTGNTLSTYILDHSVSNYRQVVTSITKWCNPYRRARIVEIDFGIIKKYTDAEIINMNIIEEIDTLSNQITSNEMKFTLNNQSKEFNILNPDGVYPYLQRKQKLKAFLGTVITDTLTEFVPMGVFYLTDWNSDEGSLTATFTARDAIDLLTNGIFTETTYTSKTIKYIVDDIMSRSGISDYVVDTALNSITVSGTLPESNYKDALQKVMIAGMAVVSCDRFGIIQIKQLSTTTTVDIVDFDNMYKSPQIKLNQLVNTVEVSYGASIYTLVDPDKLAGEQTLAVKIDNPLISTLGHATNVANWVLAEAKKRYIYEINWRQNQALESGDIVVVQDDYSEDKTVRFTKQEFNYQGYLNGKTTGRGTA